jgi:hypothetical protein
MQMARLYDLEAVALSYKQFSYHEGTFVAEISSLGKGFGWQQLYPDAADVGIAIQGKTGAIVAFYLGETRRETGDDITSWVFYPCSESIKKFPAAAVAKVIILND